MATKAKVRASALATQTCTKSSRGVIGSFSPRHKTNKAREDTWAW